MRCVELLVARSDWRVWPFPFLLSYSESMQDRGERHAARVRGDCHSSP